MTEVAFYHLQRSRLDDALPMLLSRTLAAGKKALVMASSAERLNYLDSILWTRDPSSWLPHGIDGDKFFEEHPIWLTDRGENPNGATFLFLVDNAMPPLLANFERCFILFDGNDPDALAQTRVCWKSCKSDGHEVVYWKQDEHGWKKQGA